MRWIEKEHLPRVIGKIKRDTTQRALALFLIAVLCTPTLRPTTIIAIRRQGKITLAADSKRLNGTKTGFEAVNVCKIWHTDSVYFAFSGIYEDGQTGFSASQIALNGKAGTIDFRATQFAEAVKTPLLRVAQRAHREAPEADYRQYFGQNNVAILEAIFVGMENHVAAYQYVRFMKIEDAQGTPIQIEPKIQSCPGNFCGEKGQVGVMPMGQSDAALAKFNRMVAGLGGMPDDDVGIVRHWVDAEITDQPDKVGPPISILVLDDGGVHWIDKGECGQTDKQ